MQKSAKRLTVIPKELLQFLAAYNRPVRVQNLNLPENLWSDFERAVHEKLRQSSYVVLCCRVQTCRADKVYYKTVLHMHYVIGLGAFTIVSRCSWKPKAYSPTSKSGREKLLFNGKKP